MNPRRRRYNKRQRSLRRIDPLWPHNVQRGVRDIWWSWAKQERMRAFMRQPRGVFIELITEPTAVAELMAEEGFSDVACERVRRGLLPRAALYLPDVRDVGLGPGPVVLGEKP